MPTDTRRIGGPEESFSPLAYTPTDSTKTLMMSSNGIRNDGRKCEDLRKMFIKTGVVSQARGSAYIEQRETKIICSVYGPREVVRKEEFSMKGQLTCEFKYATFSCSYRRQHQQDSEEKDFSVQLLEALEPAVCLHKFPKAQVNIFVEVLQNDGSALAASITCASMALADAGIEVYDLVIGCSMKIHEDKVLTDPTVNEEYDSQNSKELNHGSITIGFMPSLNQISAITSKGEIQIDFLKRAMTDCVEACQKIYPAMQQTLHTSIKDKLTASER
ncbi:exosome complex component MTR3 [Mytilus galloprovincialis]|uniref:Exosome complex component MTR3 n=2 Tax=Mytilus galloprovincialis TaxID=29158 RepID=A0A8B6G0E2_MYTGA|nr:exosome complex component MTR3 [Mytilus galloprovincialis]